MLNACKIKSSSIETGGVQNNAGIQVDNEEGGTKGNGEAFHGIIPTVDKITVPSFTRILAGTILKIMGQNLIEDMIIKVSGVICNKVQVSDSSNLECTLTSDIFSVSTVSVQYPESIVYEYQPAVYLDADNDWVPEEIKNSELICPNGTCVGPDCLVDTKMLFDSNSNEFCPQFDPCRLDNCPETSNPMQSDEDNNGIGNACQEDYPRDDGYYDTHACAEAIQGSGMLNEDADGDNIPNHLDPYPNGEDTIDSDGDGIPDIDDNCVDEPNPDQLDSDQNGFGDACS